MREHQSIFILFRLFLTNLYGIIARIPRMANKKCPECQILLTLLIFRYVFLRWECDSTCNKPTLGCMNKDRVIGKAGGGRSRRIFFDDAAKKEPAAARGVARGRFLRCGCGRFSN
jgi:hypothetical protein